MQMMYGHSSRLFGFALEARDRTRQAIRTSPGAAPGDAVVAVVMSVIAAEGFINELAEAARLFGSGATSPAGEQGPPPSPGQIAASRGGNSPASETDEQSRTKIASLARLLREIEDERGSIQLKYQVASLALCGSAFDPGRNPYQDFDTLVDLRNLFVHFRPRDKFQTDDRGSITGNEHPRLVRTLQQRGLARCPDPNTLESWSGTLMTAGVADWACATALEMICAVVRQIPLSSTRLFFLGFERVREQQRQG